MTTKERIQAEALTLFSENGYDGTGVEQIAGKVGIKAPSLYKHFKGKEDILNALIDKAEARYEEYFGSEQRLGQLPESREEFIRITMERVLFTMRDPMIRKIRKFLVQEQFRSDRLAAITTRHQL
ncbi:MAG: TetR/AcrR family transcriptional regulator [Ruminococcus sp.]|nr:TetR/AcrR family transcriptional regulator [Ruminococcus sp.]